MPKNLMLIVAFLVTVLTTQPAYAYIDPGSGSIILQAIIAGAIGAMLYFRNAIHSFLSFFRKSKKPKEDERSPRG